MANQYPASHQTAPEGLEDRETGMIAAEDRPGDRMAAGEQTTGGDIETNSYQAEVAGEEAIGGTTPTPGQDIVEDMAVAVGIEAPDGKPLETLDMVERRDSRRWELDPESSEDYPDHRP